MSFGKMAVVMTAIFRFFICSINIFFLNLYLRFGFGIMPNS